MPLTPQEPSSSTESRGKPLERQISHVSHPPFCIGFGDTFFNVRNFAELLFHQPNVKTQLLTFQGSWTIPPVYDIDEFAADLIRWYRANHSNMMTVDNDQKELAERNRQCQKGGKKKGKGKGKR